MPAGRIPLSKQVDRVQTSTVALDTQQEQRYLRLAEATIMVDVHQHVMVMPDDLTNLTAYLRSNTYGWCYEAVQYGGWTAVTTANFFRGLAYSQDMSFVEFDDVAGEVALMLSDISKQSDVVKVGNSGEIESAKQQGKVGFLPTLEHLAIGNDINRLDLLYGMGVRLGGLTYNRKNYIGDGQFERNDGGLSDFGIEVVHRMNQLGMSVDLSHASDQTAMDAIGFSSAPTVFSHNAAFGVRQTARARKDEQLLACAQKGGLVCVTAVPNSLSDDPKQDIECVLDHYDYMVKLVGIDHVGIGTDTVVGDHVDFHRKVMGRSDDELPAPYLDGLESPADGKNINRGLISRGYTDEQVQRIVGGNALAYFRRVIG